MALGFRSAASTVAFAAAIPLSACNFGGPEGPNPIDAPTADQRSVCIAEGRDAANNAKAHINDRINMDDGGFFGKTVGVGRAPVHPEDMARYEVAVGKQAQDECMARTQLENQRHRMEATPKAAADQQNTGGTTIGGVKFPSFGTGSGESPAEAARRRAAMEKGLSGIIADKIGGSSSPSPAPVTRSTTPAPAPKSGGTHVERSGRANGPQNCTNIIVEQGAKANILTPDANASVKGPATTGSCHSR